MLPIMGMGMHEERRAERMRDPEFASAYSRAWGSENPAMQERVEAQLPRWRALFTWALKRAKLV